MRGGEKGNGEIADGFCVPLYFKPDFDHFLSRPRLDNDGGWKKGGVGRGDGGGILCVRKVKK